MVLWPGDVLWLIDEPRLVANAYYFNQDHIPAHTGLFGNFGIPYGPVPTQTYQMLLWFTHDPLMLVVLRGLLCAVGTSIGLIWLSRSLGLRAWVAAAILLAPNIVVFHRVLWDASFTIPLGALALGGLADFLKTGSRRALRICSVCVVLLPVNHPQALPLAAPIALYLLWRHRSAFVADKVAMWRIGAVLFILHFLYIGAVIGVLHWRFTHGGNVQYPNPQPILQSALAAFMGGNLLSGFDYAATVARPTGPDWLVAAAMWTSRAIYPLIWLGILSAISHFNSARRVLRAGEKIEPLQLMAALAAVCLAFQFVLFTALRIPPGPQYFFGTFALHAFLALLGVHLLGKVRLAAPVGALLIAANGYITLGGMITVHTRGYEGPGWPTLSNCLNAVHQLNQYADQVVLTDAAINAEGKSLADYPQSIRTLRLLVPPPPGPKPRHRRLLLTYKTKDGRRTGEYTVVELARDQKRPPGAVLMDVTPLPQDWVPDPSTW